MCNLLTYWAMANWMTNDVTMGIPIDKKIADKRAKILKLGLTKEDKKNLLKKYLVAENCQSIKVPVLNAEIDSLLGAGRK